MRTIDYVKESLKKIKIKKNVKPKKSVYLSVGN